MASKKRVKKKVSRKLTKKSSKSKKSKSKILPTPRPTVASVRKENFIKNNNFYAETVNSAYLLSLVSSVIVLLSALLFLIFPKLFLGGLSLFPATTSLIGLTNLIGGLAMLTSCLFIRQRPRRSALFLLVFSIIVLIFPPHGFIMGSLLGILAALIILMRIPKGRI